MQLKDLSKQQQIEYTTKLLDLYKEMQNPAHTCDWSDIIALRETYDLDRHSKDSLRRSIILKELIEAEMIVPNTSWMTDVNDIKLGEKNIFTPKTFKQSTDYTTNHTTSEAVLALSVSDINDSNVLLRAHGFNPNEFNLLKARHSLWQQGSKKNGTKDLISSKIEVEPKNKGKTGLTEEDIKDIFEELIQIKNTKDVDNEEDNKREQGYSNYEYDSEMLLIMLSDLHLGRVTTHLETGVNSNLYSEVEGAKRNISKYLSKFRDRKFEQIVFPVGNDLMNSSFLGKTTQHENPQDNSTTTREIFKESANCMIWIIEQLAKMAPVYCPLVIGNHDAYETYAISLILSAYFRNDSRVYIDVSAQPRKYYKFKGVLLAFSHGQNDKKNLHTILIDEAKQYITNSDSIYWFTGHLHHLEAKEENGVEYWSCPAYTENDNWTKEKGFSAKQRSMGFVFNDKEMIETHFFSL